jgi:hypothetical protein
MKVRHNDEGQRQRSPSALLRAMSLSNGRWAFFSNLLKPYFNSPDVLVDFQLDVIPVS